jgi:hypothetical protein
LRRLLWCDLRRTRLAVAAALTEQVAQNATEAAASSFPPLFASASTPPLAR